MIGQNGSIPQVTSSKGSPDMAHLPIEDRADRAIGCEQEIARTIIPVDDRWLGGFRWRITPQPTHRSAHRRFDQGFVFVQQLFPAIQFQRPPTPSRHAVTQALQTNSPMIYRRQPSKDRPILRADRLTVPFIGVGRHERTTGLPGHMSMMKKGRSSQRGSSSRK